jgi:hypothetical protein
MLTAMAATTKLTVALTIGLLLVASACSNNSDDDLDLTAETTSTTAEASTTTEASTTSTTEATTTTLSERGQAEAEIRQVITGWYEILVDTSKGEEGFGLEGTTGLLRLRVIESAERRTAEGQIVRATTPSPIEITRVRINLEDGTAEADACTGSTYEFLDAETLEVITADDPTITLTSLFQLQLIDGEWKIYEWIPSDVAGNPTPCEIQR